MRVDLSTVSVACLCGHNGAGKSALLDAVTWVLWEAGRSSSDELIRLGEKEMWVDIVFDYEGRTYRVRRSRLKRASKGGNRSVSKGTLDLQILAPIGERKVHSRNQEEPVAVGAAATTAACPGHSAPGKMGMAPAEAIASHPSFDDDSDCGENIGHWRSLTGPSMRATQQAICDLLRMDHDTFVNSAYLRQGKAEEFTTRLPSERKQVLSEILGLAYFDRLQEACRMRARDARTRMEVIEADLLNLPELEKQLEDVSSRLEDQRIDFAGKEQQLKRLEDEVFRLNEQVQQLRLISQQVDQCEKQLEELRRDAANLLIQKAEKEGRREDLLQLIGRSCEIREKTDSFEQARAQIEKLDQTALSAQVLLEEKLRLQSQLASLRSRLEVELDHFKQAREECAKKSELLRHDTRDGDKTQRAYGEFKKLLREEAELSYKQDTFTRLTERAGQLQAQVTEARIKLEAELGQKELTLTELEEIVTAETLIEEQKNELEQEVKELERLESEFELVEEKGMLLKSELEGLDTKVEELRRRQEENREKIRELTEHRHETICPLCAAPIVDRAAVVGRYGSANQTLDSEITRALKIRDELEDERHELRNKYLQLKRDLTRRKDLDKRIGQFNEKQATIERARESRTKVVSEILTLEKRLDEMDFAHIERESLINVKSEIHKLEFDPVNYANLQSQIRSRRHVESRYAQLKKDQAELERLEKELPILIERENRLIEELDSESYGDDIRSSLKTVKEGLDTLNYDRDKHQSLKALLIDLLPFVEQVRDLRKAEEELPAVEDSLAHVVGMLSEKERRIPELESQIETGKESSGNLNEQQFYLGDKQEQLEVLRAAFQSIAQSVAVAQNRKEQVQKDRDSLIEKKKQLSFLADEREDHLFLAEAFGKKGIQAVIIENAVPEIESEANRILARLTDNKMHIALVTQHKTKSGTVAETLDILIGDEVGTRNYELFSGGEAFKVNFAIRIALSRLLARRAGARLETLIIDEGFGSQDDVSRERLVKAIKSVQPDFKKILVITHISEVREMFPVQIHVQKESGVSRLQVIC